MAYDLLIIGGGPAGYRAAERAGHKGMSVVLFEARSLGGVCFVVAIGMLIYLHFVKRLRAVADCIYLPESKRFDEVNAVVETEKSVATTEITEAPETADTADTACDHPTPTDTPKEDK